MPRPVCIGIDPALEEWVEEIRYTVRRLMRVAGFPVLLEWARAAKPVDLYYGHQKDVRAEVRIPACGQPFACSWFLSGAPETACPWDLWGNVDASCTALIRQKLLNKAIVSIYRVLLGRLWEERGFSPRRFALSSSFVVSHDVDFSSNPSLGRVHTSHPPAWHAGPALHQKYLGMRQA